MTMSRKPPTDLIIRLTGQHIRPWVVPLRTLAKALDASQRLIDGENTDREAMKLIGVKAGSAAYKISTEVGEALIPKLYLTGRLIENPAEGEWDLEELNALEDLSAIAKSLNCTIEFRLPGQGREMGDVLATIGPSSFERVSLTAFISGATSVIADIKRVGGATKMGCAIRVHDQNKLVYCNVVSGELVRELGKHIYKTVSVFGNATWHKKSLKLKEMDIQGFDTFGQRDIAGSISHAKQFADVWRTTKNPDKAIREIREL